MLTRRLTPFVVLAALTLAGCSGGDDVATTTPTVTVTETASDAATPDATSSAPASTPSAPATTSGGDETAFVREVLEDSPALDRIVQEDLVKLGRQACDTLASGGSEDIAEQGLTDGTQFSRDEAEDIVDAAEDHLC